MMLFDCIISQLIVKGLSKTHQDFLNINEGFFRNPTSPPLPLREDWWVFEKILRAKPPFLGASQRFL